MEEIEEVKMEIKGILIATVLIIGIMFVITYGHSSESVVKTGEKLFEKFNCYECHTINGIGYAVGPDLDGFVKHKIKQIGGEAKYKEWWKRFIKNPPATKPDTPKPLLKKIPSDGELDKIFEFLKSV